MRGRRARLAALWAILPMLFAFPARTGAESRALVVGVGQYSFLDPGRQLYGPPNDAEALVQLLTERGFKPENLTVLVEGRPQSKGPPTRDNILKSLDRMAEMVRPGDRVILYFAGHGSQQPVIQQQEHGGVEGRWDEIFLPADVRRWNGEIGRVDNAIVDDEFKAKIDAIRAKGAFVWAIFDTCHSATMTRGGSVSRLKERTVSPTELGIPASSWLGQAKPGKRATEPVSGQFGEVRTESIAKTPWVGFYAAQSDESTPEMPLPEGEDSAAVQGIFTYHLIKALYQNPSATYRRIGQHMLSVYSAYGYRPTPLFEGDGLDQPVFGANTAGSSLRQWPIVSPASRGQGGTGWLIRGGLLHQLRRGDILGVYPAAVAPAKAVRGYVEITQARLLDSEIAPIAYKGVIPIKATDLAEAYARLEAEPTESFKVALPPTEEAKSPVGMQLKGALDQIKRSGADQNIDWVSSKEAADIRLSTRYMRPGRDWEQTTSQVWLFPSTGEAYERDIIKMDIHSVDQLAGELIDTLTKMGKAIRLKKLASESSGGLGEGVNVDIIMRSGLNNVPRRLQTSALSTLHKGDELTVVVNNSRNQDVALTLLYVDSRYGITALFPQKGHLDLVHKKTKQNIATIRINAKTTGVEQLLIIAAPVNEKHLDISSLDFSFLARPTIPKGRSGTHDSLLDRALVEATFSNRSTRRSRLEVGMSSVVWRVVD